MRRGNAFRTNRAACRECQTSMSVTDDDRPLAVSWRDPVSSSFVY